MTTPNEEFRRRYREQQKKLNKPANNRRSTRRGNRPSLTQPKNNIKPSSSNKAVLPTKRNKRILSDAQKALNKVRNKAGAKNRRDYMAKTLKSGTDEFNNTKIRPSKGGKSATTGQVAKFNKSRLIKGSAKPTLRGGVVGLAMTGVEALGRAGKLGKKVQQSFQEQDRREAEALRIAKEQLRKLRKRIQGK